MCVIVEGKATFLPICCLLDINLPIFRIFCVSYMGCTGLLLIVTYTHCISSILFSHEHTIIVTDVVTVITCGHGGGMLRPPSMLTSRANWVTSLQVRGAVRLIDSYNTCNNEYNVSSATSHKPSTLCLSGVCECSHCSL